MGIASDDKTYFSGGSSNNGIKVLNDAGVIENTNITTGYYNAMGIASDKKTYFCGYGNNSIKVLDDDTGIIENTNITTGYYNAMGIASDKKTYFCGQAYYGSEFVDGSIKVLNDETGVIEDTNVTGRYFISMGIASDGRTYFFGYGIKVLNDETGIIEDTNVTAGNHEAMGVASNGRTYFFKSDSEASAIGIKVLQPVYADEKYVRRYGEWLPALGADAFNNDFTTDVDFVISEDGDTVVAEQFYKNPATGETKQINKVIPLADATHAGLMSKEQAQGATDSANAINNLDNKDVAIYDGGEYKYVTLKDLDKDYQGLATDTYVDQKVLESQQKSFEFEGSVDTFEDLPVNPKLGDVYYVSADDTDYYWNGTEWKAWQPEVDLSEYYKTSEVDSLLSTKADNTPTFTEATSRTNIASGDSAVTMWGKIRKFFTDLKAVAFSGSYNDLTDKPNIDFQLNVEQKMGYKFLGQDVYAKLVMAVSPDVSSTGRGYSTSIIIDEAALFVDARGFSTGNTTSSAFSQMAGYIKRSGGQRGNAATTGIEECFSIEFGYGATNRYLWVNWSTGYTTYMSGVQTAYIIVYYTKVAPTL
jgi:hypothetical protein